MKFLNQPIVRFLIYFAGLYILWFLLYDLWLHPQGSVDNWVVSNTIYVSEKILTAFGYVVFTDGGRGLAIEGTSGLYVGDACNAITLMALFMGFIIAYPGTLKRKIVYGLIGMTCIWLLNVLRIIFLAILETYSRAWTEFNHTYTFTFIMYGFIFLLWYGWAEKYSGFKLGQPDEKKQD